MANYAWIGPIIIKRVRDAVVLNIRRQFASDTIYPYVQNVDGSVNFDCSRITINDATPQDHFSLPTINVMTASGDEHRFLQEDFFEEFKDSNGNMSERRGAPIDVDVTVEAMAIDVITRDQLVDRLYEKFKIITNDLATNGIGILKTSILPDRRKFENDRWWYTSSISMRLYAEWLDEDISALNSTVTIINGTITTPGGINQKFTL